MQQVIPMPISLKARLELSTQRLPMLKKYPDFNLSCNDSKTKIPEYNSLFDTNLQRYFRNNHVQKVLVRNGVVDPEGRLMKRMDFHRRSIDRLPLMGVGSAASSPDMRTKTVRDPYRDSREIQATEKGITQMSVRENYNHPPAFRSQNNHKNPQKTIKVMPRGGRNHSVGLIEIQKPSRSSTPDKVYLQHRKEKDWRVRETRIVKANRTHMKSEENLRPITSQELKGIFERYKNKLQENPVVVMVKENEQSTIAEKTVENENENENEYEPETETEPDKKIEQEQEQEQEQEGEEEGEEVEKETE